MKLSRVWSVHQFLFSGFSDLSFGWHGPPPLKPEMLTGDFLLFSGAGPAAGQTHLHHGHIYGTVFHKNRSPFPWRSSWLDVPTCEALSSHAVHDMTNASQIKWRMTKGREKRRMLLSSTSRELICLPEWAYYSRVSKAEKQQQAKQSFMVCELHPAHISWRV